MKRIRLIVSLLLTIIMVTGIKFDALADGGNNTPMPTDSANNADDMQEIQERLADLPELFSQPDGYDEDELEYLKMIHESLGEIINSQSSITPNSEDTGNPPGVHVHNYVYKSDAYTYINVSHEGHNIFKTTTYKCTVCGGLTHEDSFMGSESHGSLKYQYTGSNYHSGDRHYFQYGCYCACGHCTGTEWRSKSCIGSGHVSA